MLVLTKDKPEWITISPRVVLTVGQCAIHIQEIVTHSSGQQHCPFINEYGRNQCINSLLFSIQKIPKTRDEHFEEFVLVSEEAVSY
jgi:hypothetical protein